jgi:response regulator of citrate/malate metabolism
LAKQDQVDRLNEKVDTYEREIQGLRADLLVTKAKLDEHKKVSSRQQQEID